MIVYKYIIFELIVLIAAESVIQCRPVVAPGRVPRSAVPKRINENPEDHLWPNGTVPVVIDSSLAHKRPSIIKAFNFFHQNTCIRFVRRTTQPYYIFITDNKTDADVFPTICASQIGRISPLKPQNVYLANDICFIGANIQHELLHALGFIHEHVRPDRDQYVELDYEQISKDYKQNKEQSDKDFGVNKDAVTLSPYDYVSIMHYGGKWIKKTKIAGAVVFDPVNNYGLSELDVKHLNLLYNCKMEKETEAPSINLK